MKLYSMTVTEAWEVVVWGKTQTGRHVVQWYDQQGELLHTARPPPQCQQAQAEIPIYEPNDHPSHIHVLAVTVSEKQQIALSCFDCQCIWLGSRDTEAWSVAWQATGEGRWDQPKPSAMCQGKPGQIIALKGYAREKSVSVFDITQIPFHQVEPEIKLGVAPDYLCYCDLPGVGSALAVTDLSKLSMCSLDSGKILWSVGGYINREQQASNRESLEEVKVAGVEWYPMGVCSDNRGRLYVADCHQDINSRIIVFSAFLGSVLQVVQGRGQRWVRQVPGNIYDIWVALPGITVYGPNIRYKDDEPEKGVASGSVIQEFTDEKLGSPKYLCWDEQSKSLIVCHEDDPGHKISYFQLDF